MTHCYLSRALESKAHRQEGTSSQPGCLSAETERPGLPKSGHLEEVSAETVRKNLKTVRLTSLVWAHPDSAHDSKAQGCAIFRQVLARCLRILPSWRASPDGQGGSGSTDWRDCVFFPGDASLIISRGPGAKDAMPPRICFFIPFFIIKDDKSIQMNRTV